MRVIRRRKYPFPSRASATAAPRDRRQRSEESRTVSELKIPEGFHSHQMHASDGIMLVNQEIINPEFAARSGRGGGLPAPFDGPARFPLRAGAISRLSDQRSREPTAIHEGMRSQHSRRSQRIRQSLHADIHQDERKSAHLIDRIKDATGCRTHLKQRLGGANIRSAVIVIRKRR